MPLMAALDADKDGELSAAEIKNVAKALKKLDKDGNGKLSREELRPQFRGPGGPSAGGPGRGGPGAGSFAERIMGFPEVHSLYLMSGTYDLLVVVQGKTMREVAYFVAERLAPIDHVLSTATHFVLKRYKVDGDVLEEHTETKRLPVTP